MQPRYIPTTPRGDGATGDLEEDMEMASPPRTSSLASGINTHTPIATAAGSSSSSNTIDGVLSARPPISPVRFASSTNAFRLTSSVSNTASKDINVSVFGAAGAAGIAGAVKPAAVDISPPSAGTVSTRRLRRPSLLSLTRNASYTSADSGKSDEGAPYTAKAGGSFASSGTGDGIRLEGTSSSAARNPFTTTPSLTHQPTPRWGTYSNHALIRRTSSAPMIPFDDLKTSTPPLLSADKVDMGLGESRAEGEASGSNSPMEMAEEESGQSSLRWLPNVRLHGESAARKGKAKMDDVNKGTGTTSPLYPAAGANNEGVEDQRLHAPPFTGRPLPSALVATLISENAPLEHEMMSEARLQKLITSHPSRLPFTPRAPRGSRGRFPDQVGGDDDDEEELGFGRRTSWARRTWMGRKLDNSDSDSDDEDDMEPVTGSVEPVNSAFAAGMDMDRPGSSSSSGVWVSANPSDSGKSNRCANTGTIGGLPLNTPITGGTGSAHSSGSNSNSNSASHLATASAFPPSNNAQWPSAPLTANSGGIKSTRLSFSSAGAGMVPSPGSGFGLPSAFGSLGMGGGIGTPLGSPTIERLELAGSPGGMPVSSPGLMQYRESQGGSASVRPGKRKDDCVSTWRAPADEMTTLAAQADDRFDPYKRPRGSSPSLMASSPYPLSPSRSSNAIPIPQSPSHTPLYPSALSSSAHRNSISMSSRPTHPYTRPMNTRSRAASPALSASFGSTPQQAQAQGGWGGAFAATATGTGGTATLSTSLGSTSGRGFTLAGNPHNQQGTGSNLNQNQNQNQPVHLGGLGLLSLANEAVEEEEEDERAISPIPDMHGGRAGARGAAGSEDMRRTDSDESRMEED